MKTLKTTFISLPVLVLLFVVGNAEEAQARIRVKGTLRTPHGVIQVDNGAFHHDRGYRRALPARDYVKFHVTRRDKKIARRLARYTRVPRRELIQLRKTGYTWREIGNWLGVSRKVVRAAKTERSWERFLNRRHRGNYREVGGYCDH